jgi:hypothetical protein
MYWGLRSSAAGSGGRGGAGGGWSGGVVTARNHVAFGESVHRPKRVI